MTTKWYMGMSWKDKGEFAKGPEHTGKQEFFVGDRVRVTNNLWPDMSGREVVISRADL